MIHQPSDHVLKAHIIGKTAPVSFRCKMFPLVNHYEESIHWQEKRD